jgi:hypothetical protein
MFLVLERALSLLSFLAFPTLADSVEIPSLVISS